MDSNEARLTPICVVIRWSTFVVKLEASTNEKDTISLGTSDQRKFRQLQDPSKTEGELQKVGENPHCTQNSFVNEYKILESFTKPKSGLL